MLKFFWLAMVILISLTQYRLWAGEGSIEEIMSLQKRVNQQIQENNTLKVRNDKLIEEVSDLKNGNEAIEERARKDLGMIKKGEVFYMVVDQ